MKQFSIHNLITKFDIFNQDSCPRYINCNRTDENFTEMEKRNYNFSQIMDKHYAYRKVLQKIDFITCWTVVFLSRSSFIPINFLLTVTRITAFTRLYAYICDFANAWQKYNNAIPVWLVLHHSGLLVGHFVKVFLLTSSCPDQVMAYAIGSQASHNTWMKKYSTTIYWGDVFLGCLACIYMHSTHESSFAATIFWNSFIMTVAGVSLLILDTFFHFQLFIAKKSASP